jgi:type II secretory pathway predicted ATPase ExeA
MYAPHFGLTQDPFSIAPDPRYLFMSERHREALAHLLYGVNGGGGFVLLSGEIGTGKTTVCRCFLEQIPAQCNVAYIFNPKLTVTELLRTICDEFHVAVPEGAASPKDFIDPLNAFLLRTHATGQNNVLIIDEAQNLDTDVLEQLRLLTNLETSERKLLQIVLIGQPELRDVLARPELEQLAQRVIARFHLDALSQAETAQYIAHRLSVAGHTGALPFDSVALKAHSHPGTRCAPAHQPAVRPRPAGCLCRRPGHGHPARGGQSRHRGVWPQRTTAPAAPAGPGRCSGRAAAGRGCRAGRVAEPQQPKRPCSQWPRPSGQPGADAAASHHHPVAQERTLTCHTSLMP